MIEEEETETMNSLPPTGGAAGGATGEEVLRALLPTVVSAATRAAEGQTATSAALQGIERSQDELRNKIAALTSEVQKLCEVRREEYDQKKESSAWIRSILTPQTVYYTIILLLTGFGIRATIPAPVQLPDPTQTLPIPPELP